MTSFTGTAATWPAPGRALSTRAAPVPAAHRWRAPSLLSVLTVASLAAFADKPLHVVDPFYVRVAEHIREQPPDCFETTINWYGREQALADVNQNPPLVCHRLALAGGLFG